MILSMGAARGILLLSSHTIRWDSGSQEQDLPGFVTTVVTMISSRRQGSVANDMNHKEHLIMVDHRRAVMLGKMAPTHDDVLWNAQILINKQRTFCTLTSPAHAAQSRGLCSA